MGAPLKSGDVKLGRNPGGNAAARTPSDVAPSEDPHSTTNAADATRETKPSTPAPVSTDNTIVKSRSNIRNN